MFQHTAARRRLAHQCCRQQSGNGRFNTQPPEGGWPFTASFNALPERFQHTAARRRLVEFFLQCLFDRSVSTHSRPKAAGSRIIGAISPTSFVSTHSRPKAAGKRWRQINGCCRVSTHSRPKAAGQSKPPRHILRQCFNTQPPEGGWCV